MGARLFVQALVLSGLLWATAAFAFVPGRCSPLAAAAACRRQAVAVAAVPQTLAALVFAATLQVLHPAAALAADGGANDTSNTKIKGGGASTLQRGITKTITRGVILDRSDFSEQNLRGVAFQQSIVRDCNFKNSDLRGASFFDATLDGSNFEGADLTQVNLELAQLSRTNLKNAVAKEMYIVGTTNFEGVSSIEGADFTDTELNKYQRKLLCGLESAKGTNPKTGADTRESLLCE